MASNDIAPRNGEESDTRPRSSFNLPVDPELSVSRLSLRDSDSDIHQGSSQRPSFLKCQAGRFAGRYHEDVSDFMDEVESYIHHTSMSSNEALKQLPLLLDGMAADWWRCFRPLMHAWDEASKLLLLHFGRNTKRKSKSHTSSYSHTYDYQLYDDDDDPWDLTKCPRRFHGTSEEDVHAFIDDIELYIEVKQIPLDIAFLQLDVMLEGKAASWWSTTRHYESVATWEEAKAELIHRYGYRKTFWVHFRHLQNRCQQPNERAIHYIISMGLILRKMHLSHDQVDGMDMYTPFIKALLLSYIMSGLKRSLARPMIFKGELGLLEYTTEVIRIEAVLKQISRMK